MTKLHKTLGYAAAFGSLLAVSPLSALAQGVQDINLALPGGSSFSNVVTWNATRIVQALINIILVTVGLIAFFWLLIGGVQWIMAGGDKEGTEKARKRITAALIGLVIVFSVFAFTQILSAFFGINLLFFSINAI
ncbi:MAG: Uncharacterized protein G01um101416_289 [Microgenomates group bacterium Gr01-1014_16]|nr:MAG: Uncharacterized protein G01um101416_289 [Microgenomates group bacterium Gr01-1014_16]